MIMSIGEVEGEEEEGDVEGEWKTDTMRVGLEIGDKMIRV